MTAINIINYSWSSCIGCLNFGRVFMMPMIFNSIISRMDAVSPAPAAAVRGLRGPVRALAGSASPSRPLPVPEIPRGPPLAAVLRRRSAPAPRPVVAGRESPSRCSPRCILRLQLSS